MPNSKILQEIKNDLIIMCEIIESTIDTAILSLVEQDYSMARDIILRDAAVDEMELTLDRKCIDYLRKEEPDTNGFRFAVAALKINNDLELIGDLTVDIAERVLTIISHGHAIKDPTKWQQLLEHTMQMFRDATGALLTHDADTALKVCKMSRNVENESDKLLERFEATVLNNPKEVSRVMNLLRITLDIKRIARFAGDIAEEVIYMKDGVIVRHHVDEYRKTHSLDVE